MQGNIIGQSGGSAKINGIIEEYKVASGGNINAGDFVKFINPELKQNANTKLSISTANHVIRLSENKVCYIGIINNQLHAIICTVEGNKIIKNTDTVLRTNVYLHGSVELKANLLTENKIIIIYNFLTTPHAIIFRVDENKVIKETDIDVTDESGVLSESQYMFQNASYASIIKISENKIFIASISNYYENGNYSYSNILSGMIFTIEENKVIKNRHIKLSEGTESEIYATPIEILSENKIIIVYMDGSSGYELHAIICTIDGNKIAKSTDTLLYTYINSYTNINQITLTKISENRIFITYLDDTDNDNYEEYRTIICTINGNKITKNIDTLFFLEDNENETRYLDNIITISENKIVVFYTSRTSISGTMNYTTEYKRSML